MDSANATIVNNQVKLYCNEIGEDTEVEQSPLVAETVTEKSVIKCTTCNDSNHDQDTCVVYLRDIITRQNYKIEALEHSLGIALTAKAVAVNTPVPVKKPLTMAEMRNTTVSSPTVTSLPITEDKLEMKCVFCPNSPEHTFSKCYYYNRCNTCNHYGHSSEFCKTPQNKFWDPTYESKITGNFKWTPLAKSSATVTFSDKDNKTHVIHINEGHVLPAMAQCCAFVDCKNPKCKRKYHVKYI
jgi:hypothetical protein